MLTAPTLGKVREGPSPPRVPHLTLEERAALGKRARTKTPRSSHGAWAPTPDRRDPVELLSEQANTRVAELVPIRHGRMLVSPFTYYRGAALPMTCDLAGTPTSGLGVQLCGDAHLSNFGIFGSPERHLVFDVNDFDETAPGPWEWDVKRLAASLEVAGRENELSDKQRQRIVRQAVRSYRESMREFAGMSMLEVWYAHLDMDDLLPRFRSLLDPKRTPSVWRAIAKARAHDSHQAFEKLCEILDGEPRIVHDPPLIVAVGAIGGADAPNAVAGAIEEIVRGYTHTLEPDRRQLLEQYRFVHLARKVVGVGSVGTEAWILLLLDGRGTPLLLQIKQAEASVLEPFTTKSQFANHGERVVAGQRLVQAVSDIFLGWERSDWNGAERDYYIRQLRDWKGSADVEGMTPAGMELWGRMCGWTLARGHARSGDRIAIGSYLGKSDVFDRAIAGFAVAYANQNERDYRTLQEAVSSGRLAAETGL
jgi:uncharacterized protein (DUF2252 family)